MNKETILKSYGTLHTQNDSTMGLYHAFMTGSRGVYGSGVNREEALNGLYESVKYEMAVECGIEYVVAYE